MILDKIENIENYKNESRVYKALEFLNKTDFKNIPLGKYELDGDNIFYMVSEYDTDMEKDVAEAHRKYIDIQYMIKGEEYVGVAPIDIPKTIVESNPNGDIWFYKCQTELLTLREGSFMVLYPSDIHMPGKGKEKSVHCRKVVVKVKV